MSMLPPYTGELRRYPLDGVRWKLYKLAKSRGAINQRDAVDAFGQTAGNWYNRFSELTQTGMLKVVEPNADEERKMYGLTERKKPLLVCLSTVKTISQFKYDLATGIQPAHDLTSSGLDGLLAHLDHYLKPCWIGTVDGYELLTAFKNGLEPELPLVDGWDVIWKF